MKHTFLSFIAVAFLLQASNGFSKDVPLLRKQLIVYPNQNGFNVHIGDTLFLFEKDSIHWTNHDPRHEIEFVSDTQLIYAFTQGHLNTNLDDEDTNISNIEHLAIYNKEYKVEADTGRYRINMEIKEERTNENGTAKGRVTHYPFLVVNNLLSLGRGWYNSDIPTGAVFSIEYFDHTKYRYRLIRLH